MATLQGVTLPWTASNTLLDLDYIYRWSGEKTISPLLAHLQVEGQDELDTSGYETVAGIVWSMFGDNWVRKWDALNTDYAPLDNYNMVEKEDYTLTDDSDTRVRGSASGNNSYTSASHNVYGYNSSAPVPASDDSANTSTNTDMNTDYNNDRVMDRRLTRRGNIGVTTSQQMLQSELDLRAYRFFEEVYKDVDHVVALPIYDGELTGSVYGGHTGGTGTAAVTSINGKTGDVTLFGSDIDLTTLISQSVSDAISALNVGKQSKPVILTGVLTAGTTSMTFTNSAIGDDSNIDIYFNKSGVDMTAWNQTGTTLTLTFNAYSSDVVVTVEVFNG